MVAVETWLRLVGGAVLLLANGFFVTTEFAMTRVRQFPATEFTGHPGLERAWEMTERLEIFLSGCQVGITVSSVGLGVVAEPAVAAAFDPAVRALGVGGGGGGHTALSVVLALAVINLLHVVVGEQAPTYLGVERAKVVAKHGARPLYWWTWVMSPVIYVADWISKGLLSLFGVTITRTWAEEEEGPTTREELRAQMGTALGRVGLSEERAEEVLGALELDRMEVRDVMVPREDVVALRSTDPLEQNVERMEAAPHVRFPLVGEELESFQGIVYVPALLREFDRLRSGELTLEDVAAPPTTVSADTSVADLIDILQAEGQELALVFEGGEVVGLATATDALEAITGDLEDPLDEET